MSTQFVDRQGANLNRKKITIISQTPTEIIADIERFGTAEVEGTPINAQVMNNFQSEIDGANSTAFAAQSQSAQAMNSAAGAVATANGAVGSADNAVQTAGQAVAVANQAKTTAEATSAEFASYKTSVNARVDNLETTITTNQGTAVKINNAFAANLAFSSDPQGQINTLNSSVNTISNSVAGKTGVTVGGAVQTSVAFNSNPQTQINSLGSRMQSVEDAAWFKSQLLNIAYPVGSVYITLNSANPESLIGGRWEKLDDVFLRASSGSVGADSGSNGGSNEVTLTTAQMPNHNHRGSDYYTIGNPQSPNTFTPSVYSCNVSQKSQVRMGSGDYGTTSTDYNVMVKSEGGGQAHTNMPRYKNFYVWRRTV